MGQEIACSAEFGGQRSAGRALLETDEIVFRGERRLKIAFKDIRDLNTDNGRLVVTTAEGIAVFELGPQAEKWAEKIRNPKTLIDKLGVKEGMSVSVLGVDDQEFLSDLRARAEPVLDEVPDGVQIVFLAGKEPDDVGRLAWLKRQIARDGAVWVVYRKGRKDFNENDVLRLGLETGLVDVKVVRFSETHSATKFVIRKSER